MNDPRHPQSVPLSPGPQRPTPQGPQPLRPAQHVPQPARPAPAPARPPQTMPGRPTPAPLNPHAGDSPLELDPIEMDELEERPANAAPAASKIKFGADGHLKKHDWKRQTTMTGQGACRVRTFHGKLSDQGLEYLDDAINQFLEDHPEIEIKHVTSNVGMFDGKFKDMAMIVNVWY
jgi:hypothetical protein